MGKSAHQIYEEEYALFCRQMAAHSDRVVHCRSGEDARQAHEQGKIAAFLSVEGAHSLNCDPDQLRLAYDRGVRAVNLTWNNANVLSGTNCQEPERGLSRQGREFVREMERLGMLVDCVPPVRPRLLGCDGDGPAAHHSQPLQRPGSVSPHKELDG